MPGGGLEGQAARRRRAGAARHRQPDPAAGGRARRQGVDPRAPAARQAERGRRRQPRAAGRDGAPAPRVRPALRHEDVRRLPAAPPDDRAARRRPRASSTRCAAPSPRASCATSTSCATPRRATSARRSRRPKLERWDVVLLQRAAAPRALQRRPGGVPAVLPARGEPALRDEDRRAHARRALHAGAGDRSGTRTRAPTPRPTRAPASRWRRSMSTSIRATASSTMRRSGRCRARRRGSAACRRQRWSPIWTARA